MKHKARLTWISIAIAGAMGCTLNGKSVGWPGGGGGGGATQGAGATPAWCDVDGVEELDARLVKHTVETDDPKSALYDLAGHFCDPDHTSHDGRQELEAARQRWSKQVWLTDAEWRDVVEWALRPQLDRNAPSLTVDAKRTLSSLDAVEQYAVIAASYGDKAYLADALEPRLTAIGRLAYVEDCLARAEVGAWAVCHADVEAFDAGAIVSEVRGLTRRSGYERITIRLKVLAAAPKVAARLAAVKALVAQDPAYATLFSIGAEVRVAWSKRAAADGARDLALALDDARRSGSRKAFDGCADQTWQAFERAVRTLPARRFAGLFDEPTRPFAAKAASVALDDADVYLAANAMVICASGEAAPPDYLVRTLAGELDQRAGHRGPRTSTHSALVAAAVTLDDRDARLVYPEVERAWLPLAGGSSGGGKGVVASVAVGPGPRVISFAKEMATYVECTKWKATGRIDRIDRDGRIVYESSCVASAKKRHDQASPPLPVNGRYLAAVRPKAYVLVTEDVVTAVWASPGDGVPAAVLGVALR